MKKLFGFMYAIAIFTQCSAYEATGPLFTDTSIDKDKSLVYIYRKPIEENLRGVSDTPFSITCFAENNSISPSKIYPGEYIAILMTNASKIECTAKIVYDDSILMSMQIGNGSVRLNENNLVVDVTSGEKVFIEAKLDSNTASGGSSYNWVTGATTTSATSNYAVISKVTNAKGQSEISTCRLHEEKEKVSPSKVTY
jgi:hypothetical protein